MSGLDPGSKYVGELTGHNVKGNGVPTQINVYTLKLPEKLIPNIEDSQSSGKEQINVAFIPRMRLGVCGERVACASLEFTMQKA